jgi:colanic acid biosynthesis glycosyl transferase WcaI
VAIIASNFWPEPTGSAQTVGEFAWFLARAGADVRVATSMPYYPQWRIAAAYRGRIWLRERHEGVTMYRAWHLVRPRPSTMTRVLHELTLTLLSIPSMLRVLRRAKVAFVSSPDLSYAFVGLLIARLMRIRAVLLVKDVMPDAAVELGMLRNRLMIGLSRFLARRAYAWANEIHTLGEGMRQRIARDTEAPRKIRIVPDTIDAAELAPVERRENEFRKRYVPDGVFAVLHTGNMGNKQDLDLLLRAARRLRSDPKVHFYVFGEGSVKTHFLRTKEEWGLENVSLFPLQERPMLRHMLSGADVVLVSQRREVVDIVVPSKLITALASGAMIVVACPEESETARLIRESGGGLWVPAGDDAGLVAAIDRIRGGGVDVQAHRRNAREYALATFDRSAVYGPVVRELLLAS